MVGWLEQALPWRMHTVLNYTFIVEMRYIRTVSDERDHRDLSIQVQDLPSGTMTIPCIHRAQHVKGQTPFSGTLANVMLPICTERLWRKD